MTVASRIGATGKLFDNKFPYLGPLIYFASVLYFIFQVLVARAWHPPYSFSKNSISDLGNTSCTPRLCSPDHHLMFWGFLVLGLVMTVGSFLLYQEFAQRSPTTRRWNLWGFACVFVGGVGTIFVACFPENKNVVLHGVGAFLAIVIGNLGMLLLGLKLGLPKSLRGPMVFFAALSFPTVLLFVLGWSLGLGNGTMERIAAYPETVWLIVFGLFMTKTRWSRRSLANS